MAALIFVLAFFTVAIVLAWLLERPSRYDNRSDIWQ